MEPPKPILVAAGGIAGAGLRWAALDLTDQAIWALIAVNALGGFLLGLVVHGLLRGSRARRLLLGVGFCGSFTTFSTFAVEVARDLDAGSQGDAALTVSASLGVGLLAAALGAATGRTSA